MRVRMLLRAAAIPALVLGTGLSGCVKGDPESVSYTPPAGPEPTPITIDDTDVYPESVTSTQAGDLIVGSVKGNIYRTRVGNAMASVWVRPDETNGLQSVFGVLAHEPSGTLWVCSVPNPFQPPVEGRVSELVALDLATGSLKARYRFPPPRSVCNDMTVGRDGSVYAADTQNGRIILLAPGASELTVWGEDPLLKGIDGIAFSEDWTLYANNVTTGQLLRVDIQPDGSMGKVTTLTLNETLGGPDGMRLLSGNTFLLAEGSAGRIDLVTINGDSADVRVIKSGLNSSPGVTAVGNVAWTMEGKIGYLVNPDLRGQDPGPFMLIPVPLP